MVMADPLKTETFRARVQFLKDSQFWPAAEFERYQIRQLKELLQYCGENIPYYENLFRKEGIDPQSISKLEDLKRIPFLTKQDIQGRYDEFIPQGVSQSSLVHRSTGGSTGTPLTVYSDLEFLSRDKANTVYYMGLAGYNPFDYGSLRIYGDKIPAEYIERGEYWYEKDNKLIVSCYHYDPQTLPLYIKKINAYQPDYIHSRASAILPLSQYLREHPGVLSAKPGAVFLDGEILTDSQRDTIEAAWGCRVYNTYGHTEGCAVGVSCCESRLLHFMPQVGIVELLDEDGQDVLEEDAVGELVVTGFNSRVFPLIRYRSFDFGTHTNAQCPCGRKYKLLKNLEGRIQDFVVNKNRQLVPLAPAVFNYNDMDWKGIKQFQVLQEAVGVLRFRIVREEDAESAQAMTQRILAAFNKIFNHTFQITIEFVPELTRTKIGKFRYLEQKLNMADFNRLGVTHGA